MCIRDRAIIAIGECGYKFDLAKDSPDEFDVDLYQLDTMRELAEQFVDEGLYGTCLLYTSRCV